MLGNTCSAKLKVPADLPFTEQGAHPCSAQHTARNRNQLFPFHKCILADKKSSRALRLYILQLLKTPKSFGLSVFTIEADGTCN